MPGHLSLSRLEPRWWFIPPLLCFSRMSVTALRKLLILLQEEMSIPQAIRLISPRHNVTLRVSLRDTIRAATSLSATDIPPTSNTITLSPMAYKIQAYLLAMTPASSTSIGIATARPYLPEAVIDFKCQFHSILRTAKSWTVGIEQPEKCLRVGGADGVGTRGVGYG